MQPNQDMLEPYRDYLTLLARTHMDRRLSSKLDASDIAQEVLLRAARAFTGSNAPAPEALGGWLRAILANTLADSTKHFQRDKRSVGRERSIEADLDRSTAGLAGFLITDQTSPSQAAIKNEQLLRLAQALERLPDNMREVVVLKHCRDCTLQEIATTLDKSTPAIASLLRRGLSLLREFLAEDDE